jgi:ketosteroid isomerase-like protein
VEPIGALAEFYRAFNNRDLALMEQNWASSDETSMDNPLGGIRRGWNEIRPVYERIFNSQARVSVEFYDYTIHRFGATFLAVGRERGRFATGEVSLDLQIRTSRLFRLTGGRWRQVHHHGSIDDAGLLARYQAAVTDGSTL